MGDKKLVLKLDLNDPKEKKKAMKAVTGLIGIDFVCMDMKDKKMTVIGMIDPVRVVGRLRKFWRTDVVSIGPAKPPEPKKEEPKKEEAKKEEPKKEEAKKEEPKKEEPKKEEAKKEEPKKEEAKKEEPKEEAKKERDPNEQVAELVKMYRAYNPQMTVHYVVHSVEDDPTSCVIC